MNILISIILVMSSAIVRNNDALNNHYDPQHVHLTLYSALYPHGTAALAPSHSATASAKTIIIHGWSEDSTALWVTDLRVAYLRSTDPSSHVIVVDYGWYSRRLGYLEMLSVTEQIGCTVGQRMALLLSGDAGGAGGRVHCVGFSLGAQLCGFVARQMMRATGAAGMGLIIGLDAAGPGFDRPVLWTVLPKLRSGDAKLVVGYYTSGNEFGFGALTSRPYADYNVMVNGGSIQPNCGQSTLQLNLFNNTELKKTLFCNHITARRIKILSQLSAVAGTPPTNDYQVTLCSTYEVYVHGGCARSLSVPLLRLNEGLVPHGNYYFRTDTDLKQIL